MTKNSIKCLDFVTRRQEHELIFFALGVEENLQIIRIYAGKFAVEKTKTPGGVPFLLMNLPYYLGTQLPQYIRHFVEEYKL